MLLQQSAVDPTTPTAASDTARVRAAISRLSPSARDLLVLRFRDDRSVAELAGVTGTSPALVQQGLHRAAWAVEDAVGPVPAGEGHRAERQGDRPVALVEEEALLGITPMLAARLITAVGGETPPAADHRWRWHALLGALRAHGEAVVTGLVTLAVVLPNVASLAS